RVAQPVRILQLPHISLSKWPKSSIKAMGPIRFFLGEDIFISYSRADATTYATRLANYLAQKGFSCTLDQWGTVPGQQIPPRVLHALKRSSMLVLIGSPQAVHSVAVETEVRLFLETKRSLVPISIDQALERAPWFPVIVGASISQERMANLEAGEPSALVLS